MNKTLFQLAKGNVKKYKRHYFIMGIFVFVIALFFGIFVQSKTSDYITEKKNNIETYGEWYFYTRELEEAGGNVGDPELDYENPVVIVNEYIEDYNQSHDAKIKYGYLSFQGTDYYNNFLGYMDDDAKDLCNVKLTEGRYPTNDDEVVIASDLCKRPNYEIGETIRIKILGESEDRRVTIVGIVESPNEGLPKIYTNFKDWDENYLVLNSDLNISLNFSITASNAEYVNPYGYTVNKAMLDYAFSEAQLLTLVEVLCIVSFILFVITSTSLKKRMKEFALLRGIGMTTKQLIGMVLYENVMVSLPVILIGIALSLPISFVIMKMKMQIFIPMTISQILSYFIIIQSAIIIACIFPIFSSANNALSGSFDGEKFKYFYVRYKDLKYQNSLRLAKRELKSNKKIHLSFLVLASIFAMTFISRYKLDELFINTDGYIQVTPLSNEDLSDFNQVNLKNMQVLNYIKMKDMIVDYNGERHKFGEEVYICPFEDERISKGNKVFIDQGYDESDDVKPYNEFGNNNLVLINNDFYEIVDTKNLDFLNEYEYEYDDESFTITPFFAHSPTVYMNQENYEKVSKGYKQYSIKKIYFSSNSEFEEAISYLMQFDSISIDSYYPFANHPLFTEGEIARENYLMPSYLLVTYIIIITLFCYSMYKSALINDSRNYALLRVLGASKKTLYHKQFYMSVIMSLRVFIIEFIWYLFQNGSLKMNWFMIKIFLVSFLVIFTASLIVYVFPLKYLLDKNYIDDITSLGD